MTSVKQTPQIGDIVLLKQQKGIGVVRYIGSVDFDDDNVIYYGIEVKGPSVPGGHDGSYNGRSYFVSKQSNRGIFVREIIRIITSEEILEKLAEVYDILKGRRGHSHFIDRATYDELIIEHQTLRDDLEQKKDTISDLERDLSLLKEQVLLMKGTLGDKIDETANLTSKINKAERKIGSRLSQIDLTSVTEKLLKENNDIEQQSNQMNINIIPDYSKTKTHRKQRSSTTIELDKLNDDFAVIARNVSGYGDVAHKISSPMHYRKFSNTTKQIMDQHKAAGVPVGDYGNQNQNVILKSSGHKARGSVQIGNIIDDDLLNDDNDINKKRRKSIEDIPPNTKPTRQQRQSKQLDDDDLDDINAPNGYFNDNSNSNSNSNSDDDNDIQIINSNKPKRKARRSIDQNQGAVLTATALKTFNEHQDEDEYGKKYGPKGNKPKHKRGDSMTSNSSEYKKFMQVD